eukprot:COSAG06_NODE_11456_length_1505_cov_166.593883_1_plen_430_part_10
MGPAEQQGGSGSGGSTNLFQAVMRSDTVALDKLLSAGAHINRPNMAGLTPLMLAIERDRPVAKQFLEERGPAHLYARYINDDERVQQVMSRPVYGYVGSAVRLQLLELELRHPEQRQASLRRLLSFSGGTVDEVSRIVDQHTERVGATDVATEAETEAAVARKGALRLRVPKGRRLRLEGTGVTEGLDMVDAQELFDELELLADPEGAKAATTALAAGADSTKQERPAPRRASVCTFGDSQRDQLCSSYGTMSFRSEPEPEPEPEPSFDSGWFPESDGGESEERPHAYTPVVSDSDDVPTSSSSSGEEEQEREECEQPVSRSKSCPGGRGDTPTKSKTTASGKIKKYSNVQSRVDARRRRSKSDAAGRQQHDEQLHQPPVPLDPRYQPRLTMAFGEQRPAGDSWYPSAAREDSLHTAVISADRLRWLIEQ